MMLPRDQLNQSRARQHDFVPVPDCLGVVDGATTAYSSGSIRQASRRNIRLLSSLVSSVIKRVRPGRRHCSVQVRHRLAPPKAAMTGRGSGRWMVPVLRMATIGVYGFDGESFLERLRRANVGLLLDVRQRRGVRGSQYAWANSPRLHAALAHDRIAYEHHPELAPNTELRLLQYAEDDCRGFGKRSRRVLAAEYVAATRLRSSTVPTSRPSCRRCRAMGPQRCSVSSATLRPATDR